MEKTTTTIGRALYLHQTWGDWKKVMGWYKRYGLKPKGSFLEFYEMRKPVKIGS